MCAAAARLWKVRACSTGHTLRRGIDALGVYRSIRSLSFLQTGIGGLATHNQHASVHEVETAAEWAILYAEVSADVWLLSAVHVRARHVLPESRAIRLSSSGSAGSGRDCAIQIGQTGGQLAALAPDNLGGKACIYAYYTTHRERRRGREGRRRKAQGSECSELPSMASSLQWIHSLNSLELPPTPPNGSTDSNLFNTNEDDLNAQLAAWTNADFGSSNTPPDSSLPGSLRFDDLDASATSRSVAAGAAAVSGGAGGAYAESAGGQDGGRNCATDNKRSLHAAGIEDVKDDPSPYAKRPFGQFGHNYALERGFSNFSGALDKPELHQPQQHNAFAPVAIQAEVTANPSLFDSFFAGLGFPSGGLQQQDQSQITSAQPAVEQPLHQYAHLYNAAVPASAAEPYLPAALSSFTAPAAPPSEPQSKASSPDVQQPQNTPVDAARSTSALPSKKRRLQSAAASPAPVPLASPSATSSSSAAGTPSLASSAPASSKYSATAAAAAVVLTKAAVLEQQAAALKAQKCLTEEEEAARLEELNRIATEDDKRRRNTAASGEFRIDGTESEPSARAARAKGSRLRSLASARFRVKKKQKEAAFEDTIRQLNEKIDKLQKDLEATKTENNFLRDLVIRKVTSIAWLYLSISGPFRVLTIASLCSGWLVRSAWTKWEHIRWTGRQDWHGYAGMSRSKWNSWEDCGFCGRLRAELSSSSLASTLTPAVLPARKAHSHASSIHNSSASAFLSSVQ